MECARQIGRWYYDTSSIIQRIIQSSSMRNYHRCIIERCNNRKQVYDKTVVIKKTIEEKNLKSSQVKA